MTTLAPELVSAGAGTGKTYNIVERIVAAVAGGTPIGRIAAITFTNRAAAELQRRLKKRLGEKGHAQAALEVDAAFVSTIHSFCLRLATEHPVESKVPPETRPIEERETQSLLERAISQAMAADPAIADEVRFITRECLQYSRNTGSAEDQLRSKVLNLVECVRALAKTSADLKGLADRNDADLVARLPAPASAAQMQQILQPLLKRYSEWWTKTGQAMKPTQKNAGNHASLEPFLAGGPLPVMAFWDCKLGLVGNPKWAAHDEVVAPLQQAIPDLLFRHPDWRAWYRRYARALFSLAGAALTHYEAMKRALNVMDYSDMQTSALDLMSRTVEGKPFAEYLRARFDLIVVDEFQDTSPLQFAIIEQLRGVAVQGRYVGDLKQAIYGWRDADSRLFQTLIHGAATVETLRENRRSRKRLVEFFNSVCRPMIPTIGLAYDDLVPKSVYVEDKVPAFGDELSVLYGSSSKAKTAERIALWILGLLSDTSQQVWSAEEKAPRRLRPGDIAVLVRYNADADAVTQALGKLGLRSSEAHKGVGNRPEVQLFRALVAAFANTENRLSMAAVLAGEVYGLSHGALQGASKLLQTPRSYYVEEVRAEVERQLPPDARAAVQRYYSDLDDLKPRFRREPLLEAVDRMIERTRLRDRLAGKPEGRLCLANLDLCRQTVAAFLAATSRQLSTMGISGEGVEAFLAWFDQRLGPDEEIAQTRPVDEEAVQVMTIHKSKGLEFPITVVHGLDASTMPRFDRKEMVRPLTSGSREMIEKAWIRYFPNSYRPLPDVPLLGDAASESRADAVRNLYVAMTRAQERLVLVWPEEVDADSYAGLLEAAGLRIGESALEVGKESFPAAVISAVHAPPPPPPAQDPRAAALAAPDPGAFAFEEIPARDPGGFARLSPTLLCRLFDGPEAYYREEICGGEHLGPSKRAVTLKIETTALPGVATPAPSLKGRTDLGDLLHRALAAELELPETLKRVEALGGPAVRTYAERVLGPLRSHFETLRPTGPFLVEHPFLYRLGGSVLSGVLDLAVPTREGLWIYDLKTNDITAAEVPLYAQYYAPQLWSYALGAARSGIGKVVGLRLAFATPAIIATVPLCPPDFEKSVAAAVNGILQAGVGA
jgi:ATP-dependent exoDNAse (exonuclease V) beta subunit